MTVRLERALSDSLARMLAGIREGRRIEVRGFDPKELEKLREMSRIAGAMPNAARATTSGLLPRPGDPALPPATVYRTVPPEPPPFPRPAPGIRRVLVGAARMANTRRDIAAVGAAIADSLRRAIAARPGYDVVDASVIGDPRIVGSRSRTGIARAVGAGAVLNGLYFPRPDSLVVLQIQVFDVQRNRIVQVLESKPIDPRDPMRDVGDLVSSMFAALEAVDWRAPADSGGTAKPR